MEVLELQQECGEVYVSGLPSSAVDYAVPQAQLYAPPVGTRDSSRELQNRFWTQAASTKIP